MKTHIAVVLDRSGSMGHLEDETIGAYNAWLADIKKASKGQKVLFTLHLFDDRHDLVYQDTPLSAVKKLDSSVYFARGMTALNDAFGQEILRLKDEADKNDRVVILVMTDGLENNSREITPSRLKALVRGADERPNWTIMYIGANQDAFAVGRDMGLTLNNTRVTSIPDSWGTQAAYATSSANIGSMLRGGQAKAQNVSQHDYDTKLAEIKGEKPPKRTSGGRPKAP